MTWQRHFPARSCDHLTDAKNVARARADFLRRRPRNLDFLLRKRYAWMNEYLDGKETVVELGCGLGLSREYIRNPRLMLTDVNDYPWIDRRVDALDLPFADGSVDAFICGHLVHHLAFPLTFFDSVARLLKPGGYVLIQELECSPFLKMLLWLRGNEGWDDGAPVFDRAARCTPDPADPWAANCAIPRLLFSSPRRFEKEAGGLAVIRDEPCECLLFPASGGVLAKVPAPVLPSWALALIDRLDEAAVRAFPRALALGRRVALQKR